MINVYSYYYAYQGMWACSRSGYAAMGERVLWDVCFRDGSLCHSMQIPVTGGLHFDFLHSLEADVREHVEPWVRAHHTQAYCYRGDFARAEGWKPSAKVGPCYLRRVGPCTRCLHCGRLLGEHWPGPSRACREEYLLLGGHGRSGDEPIALRGFYEGGGFYHMRDDVTGRVLADRAVEFVSVANERYRKLAPKMQVVSLPVPFREV
jgi:hypothetical protein